MTARTPRTRKAPAVIWLFFFQAEDGIRAGHVTGVQTCALPIYIFQLINQGIEEVETGDYKGLVIGNQGRNFRSEERRVGKECRARAAAEHDKKNMTNNGTSTANEHTLKRKEYGKMRAEGPRQAR